MKLDHNIIDAYLHNNLEIIYDNFTSSIYLIGGSIKDLVLNQEVRDIDIVVLSDDDSEIKSFIDKYNLQYQKNNFNGYKIKYGDLEIDIWNSNDLYKCIIYNYDGLFYDIKNSLFIPFGFFDAIETKELKQLKANINEKRQIVNNLTRKRDEERKQKILKSMRLLGDINEKK